MPFISVFEHTYARALYTPVAPSGAQNEPGRTLATTGDPPAATVVEVLADATVVAVVALDRPVFDGVVDDVVDGAVATVDETVDGVLEGVVDGVVDGVVPATSDQPRNVVPAH